MDNTIDPQVKSLVSAIGRAETGDPSPDAYSKRGKSGEFGRYQFMPETWKMWAKETLGDENAQPTMENQNKIAYTKVKQWKDAGLNPAQIASKWNSGDENAYKKNHAGVNAQGVAYDTPAYTAKVSQYYNELKGGQSQTQQVIAQQAKPTTPLNISQEKKPTIGGEIIRGVVKPFAQLGTSLVNAGQDIVGVPETQPFSGKYLGDVNKIGKGFDITNMSPESVKGALSAVGTGAELGSNLVGGEGLGSIAEQGLKGLVKQGIIKGAKTGAITGALQQGGQALSEGESLGKSAIKTVTGALTGGITGGLLGGVGGTVGKGLEKLGVNKITENRIAGAGDKELFNLVNPKLTLAKYRNSVAKGTAEKIDQNVLKSAQAIKGIVDPSASLEENIGRVRDAIGTEAESLKEKILPVDHPITFKELQSNLRKVDLPITFKNDKIANKTLSQITDTAMKIAKKNGGKVSSLLDARKEFDRLVEESFPKLYENGKPTPNYFAITRTRQAINDFIEKELPEGFGFKESLAKQSGMYNAINGMKTKLTLPVSKLKGFMQKHPLATQVGLRAIEGTAIGGAIKGLGLLNKD